MRPSRSDPELVPTMSSVLRSEMGPTEATVAASPRALRHVVRDGPRLMETLGEAFDDLALACGAPITARRPWLECWLRTHPEYHPVAVVVEDHRNELRATALFGVRRRRWGAEVLGLGHGSCDQARLYVRDENAGHVLATGVGHWLRRLTGQWRLTLAQLPAGDAVTAALQAVLPYSAIRPAVGSPVVVFGEDRRPSSYISANSRGQANNKWNRLVRNGHDPAIELLCDPDPIAKVLPRVVAIATVRQEELTGRPKLASAERAAFFQAVALEHARRGEAEVLLLRIKGEIAAYTITFLDHGVARMWSGHYDPRWSEYSPGHILSRKLIERCLETPSITELDWMLGMEPYKLRSATRVVAVESLHAWSGLPGWAAGSVLHGMRRTATETRDRYPVLRHVQLATRRLVRRSSVARDE
jgi:hypothetical protein